MNNKPKTKQPTEIIIHVNSKEKPYMNIDDVIEKYEIQPEKNYLLIVKVKSMDRNSIGGLDEAIKAISTRMKSTVMGLVVSADNEYKLINHDDGSVEQALVEMGFKEAEEKKEDEDIPKIEY